MKPHARGAKFLMVLGRQLKQWSAREGTSASCMAIAEVWVDPLRDRAGRGTDDEKSRQGGRGFLEHGFDYSDWYVCRLG
jgi:hypothetical protein